MHRGSWSKVTERMGSLAAKGDWETTVAAWLGGVGTVAALPEMERLVEGTLLSEGASCTVVEVVPWRIPWCA
jgi:hypothetical protein